MGWPIQAPHPDPRQLPEHPDPAQGWDPSKVVAQRTISGSQRAPALLWLACESDFSQTNIGLLLPPEVEIALLTSKDTAVYHQFLLHANVSENRDTITGDN